MFFVLSFAQYKLYRSDNHSSLLYKAPLMCTDILSSLFVPLVGMAAQMYNEIIQHQTSLVLQCLLAFSGVGFLGAGCDSISMLHS